MTIVCSALLSACEPEQSPVPARALPALPERAAEAEPPRGPERPPRALSLALVGEVRGEFEPCGCPTLPYGGFQRRARQLAALRAEGPVFHLDAGELLVKGNITTRAEERATRAALMDRLSAAVGLDAWSLSPTDLATLGQAGLLGRAAGPARLGAGWRPTRPGAPAPLPAVVLERAGLRVGVIGVTSAPPEAAPPDGPAGGPPESREATPGWRALPAPQAVAEALATLPADLDLVVALGDLDEGEADAIARLPGLALVLSTQGRALDAPHSPTLADGRPGALVVEAPDRGRFLQVVRLRLGAPGGQPAALLPSEAVWRDHLTAQSVAAARGAPPPESPAFAALGPGRNLAMVELLPLAADLELGPPTSPEEQAVLSLLREHRQKTVEQAKVAVEAPPTPAEPGFAGGGACARCHSREVARWALTDHADAWLDLVRADRGSGPPAHTDPECARCHSTGYAQPGGLAELSGPELSRLKAVQCEACHGPMRGHPDAPAVAARAITAERCTGCHDAANSPNFDFDRYLPMASCQGGAPELLPPGTQP